MALRCCLARCEGGKGRLALTLLGVLFVLKGDSRRRMLVYWMLCCLILGRVLRSPRMPQRGYTKLTRRTRNNYSLSW